MKLVSRRISRTVIGLTGGFVLACSAILFFSPAVFATSLDKEGEYYFKIDCPASDIDLVDYFYAEGTTNYTFSGTCSQSTNTDALPNFPYKIKGTWSQTTRIAKEEFTSTYGTYRKSGLCTYDPWLDPTVLCETTPAYISNNSEVMTHLKAKLDKWIVFPISKGPFEIHRTGVLPELLNQSLRVVQPQENKTYDVPEQVAARVTTAWLVSRATFPENLVAILQIDEKPQWPDPNKPASTSRSFTLTTLVEDPGDGSLYPRATFETGSTDLWDGAFSAKAHLLVADPYWTPAVSFSVGPAEQLGPPPEKPLLSEVKPTAVSQLSSSPGHVSLPHRLAIMSPQTGQSVFGDLTVKINLWGYPEATATDGPEISLDWTWSPFSKPGDFPPIPKTMDVTSKMHGTELIIPRSAFTENGIWSVTATIKESENTFISDRASFKIRELSNAAGQFHLSPSTQAQIKPATTLTPGAEKLGAPAAEIPTLPSMNLKSTEKPKPRVQAKTVQQHPASATITGPKTAPTIIRPTEREHFNKPGFIPISARVSADDASLVWEIEYQAFGAASFARQQPSMAGTPATGIGTIKNARFNVPEPGTYRFRIKEDGAQTPWSSWRTVIVGSPPPAPAPAAKMIQRTNKPAPALDTIKNEPQQQPTKPEPRTQQKTIKKPITVKQPTAPIALPRQ